jgi:hypothetical protein
MTGHTKRGEIVFPKRLPLRFDSVNRDDTWSFYI